MFSPVGVKQKSPPARLSLAGAKPHRAGGGDVLQRFFVASFRCGNHIVQTQIRFIDLEFSHGLLAAGCDGFGQYLVRVGGNFQIDSAGGRLHLTFSRGVRGPVADCLSRQRHCLRRVSDGVIVCYVVSARNRYRPWNLKKLKDFSESPFRLGFLAVSEVGVATFFPDVAGNFAGIGLGQQVSPIEWRSQPELLTPLADGLDLPPVGVGNLLHGEWLFHDWIRLPSAIPKRNSVHGRGSRSWKAHTSHAMTATR